MHAAVCHYSVARVGFCCLWLGNCFIGAHCVCLCTLALLLSFGCRHRDIERKRQSEKTTQWPVVAALVLWPSNLLAASQSFIPSASQSVFVVIPIVVIIIIFSSPPCPPLSSALSIYPIRYIFWMIWMIPLIAPDKGAIIWLKCTHTTAAAAAAAVDAQGNNANLLRAGRQAGCVCVHCDRCQSKSNYICLVCRRPAFYRGHRRHSSNYSALWKQMKLKRTAPNCSHWPVSQHNGRLCDWLTDWLTI